MSGVDLTRIDGMNENSVLKVLSETGTDMSAWPTEKHFSSWLGLSPSNKITGGKVLSSKTKPSADRVAASFRTAAFALFNSKSALGAYLRRMHTRLEYLKPSLQQRRSWLEYSTTCSKMEPNM